MKENIYLELWCSSPQKKKKKIEKEKERELWCSLNNKLLIIFLYSFFLVVLSK